MNNPVTGNAAPCHRHPQPDWCPRPGLGRRHRPGQRAHRRSPRPSPPAIEILEFSLHDSVNLNRDKTRELLTANGIQAACSRGLARDADVSSDDPAVVARGAALLRESLEVTHAIGATILTGALYSAFGKAAHPLTPTGRDNVVGVLKELAAEAAPLGVTLGLEICNRYETNVVNTARDCLRLADDIGADNVVIHLDTYHMNIEERRLRHAGTRTRRPARLRPYR